MRLPRTAPGLGGMNRIRQRPDDSCPPARGRRQRSAGSVRHACTESRMNHPTEPLTSLLITVTAGTLLLTGCGTDDESPRSTEPSTPSTFDTNSADTVAVEALARIFSWRPADEPQGGLLPELATSSDRPCSPWSTRMQRHLHHRVPRCNGRTGARPVPASTPSHSLPPNHPETPTPPGSSTARSASNRPSSIRTGTPNPWLRQLSSQLSFAPQMAGDWIPTSESR